MIDSNDSVSDGLMAYWRQASELNLLNQRVFARDKWPGARLVPLSQIEKGWLDNCIGEEKSVYLAPFCFRSGSDLTIPFWLEADLLPTGELKAKKHATFPWVMPTFLDSLSPMLPILASVHLYDALVDSYMGSPDNPVLFQDWKSFYKQALLFMSELCPNWKDAFTQSGFECFEGALLLPSLAAPKELTPNALLQTYAQLEYAPSKFLEEISASIVNPVLKTPLFALSGLESGDCLAITYKEPHSSRALIMAWLRQLYIERALNKEALPTVLILNSDVIEGASVELPQEYAFSAQDADKTFEKYIALFKAHFSADQFTDDQLTPDYALAYIHEALTNLYKQYQEGLSWIPIYQEKLALKLEAQIEALQKQDEHLEQRYQNLLSAQRDLTGSQSKGILAQIWEKWLKNKAKTQTKNIEKMSQYLVLEETQDTLFESRETMQDWVGENLRKIQVERTKLHGELIHLSESLIEQQGLWTKLSAWQNKHKLVIFSEKTTLNFPDYALIIATYFEKQLFDLANLYWKAKRHLGVIFLYEVVSHEKWLSNKSPSIDEVEYLFLQEANGVSPMMGAELCSAAQRMIGLSSSTNKAFYSPILTPLQDSFLTHRYQLTQHHSDAILEEMGALVSTGNAFQLIQTHSVYEDPTYPGMGYTRTFYLEAHDKLIETGSQLGLSTKMDFQPIVGQMVADRGSFVNQPEALHLLNWLKNKESSVIENAIIVTVFAAQKDYLNRIFTEAGLSIPVYCLKEAIGKKAKWVIMSMVYTPDLPGASVYDQNPWLLPEISKMAKEQMVIFADPGVFSLSHTTLGKFAQKVWAKTAEPLNKDKLIA